MYNCGTWQEPSAEWDWLGIFELKDREILLAGTAGDEVMVPQGEGLGRFLFRHSFVHMSVDVFVMLFKKWQICVDQ